MTSRSGRPGSESKYCQKEACGDLPNRGATTSSRSLSEGASRSQLSPNFITGIPVISETSTLVAQAATYFGQRFAKFVEEPVTQDEDGSSVDTSKTFGWPSSREPRLIRSTADTDQGNASFSSVSRNVVQSSSNTNTLCSTVERATSIISSTSSALIGAGQNLLNFRPTIWDGLVTRIQTTLRGSGDDIGWLQCMPGVAPVDDRTDRFIQILGFISNGVHKVPNTLVYLLIPGLFSNHGPLYFVETKKYFSKLGLACHIAKIHSEAAVETNALELRNCIDELYWGSGKRILLLGHSKGGVDASAAVAMYWPDLREKVAGLVLVQSPYGGSPIASDILREGQIADLETRRFLELLICNVIKGDIRSLEDLTYEKRREFLAKYPLPPGFPTVSFHTELGIALGKLSTMSHIAHAEFPWLSVPNHGAASEEPTAATKLPVVIPLAATMAACALHLELRYKAKSDGLVVRKDAEVPGSIVVRPDRKLDHAWMVYSPATKEENEPNSSEMCEALITLLLETNQEKKDV